MTTYTQSLVAFLDILGFSDIVQNDCNSASTNNLEKIIEIVKVASDALSFGDVRQFSDSIVCSVNYSIDNIISLINAIQKLQNSALEKGVLLRGGISLGKHYSDSNLLFSEALVNAYKIESVVARFPRVVLDSNIIELIEIIQADHSGTVEKFTSLICKDVDGEIFVSYCQENYGKTALDLVRSALSKKYSSSIREKYIWLGRYIEKTHTELAQDLEKFLPKMTLEPHDIFVRC
jgi:hypothetical protein